MIETPAAREFRELPLAVIDRPELDARIDRSPEFLDALTSDIARRGVLVPLIVVVVGDRYEVVDGFTRYIAATRANLVAVPCCIYPTKELALEGVKYAATQFHENFSPADEAIYFRQLLDGECGGDIEKLCALVNKKLTYVDNRLALINGDADVFEAVKAKKIQLGVAALLNSIDDDSWRRYYLLFAIKGGASVSMVTGWVQQHNAMYADRPDVPVPETAPGGDVVAVNTYDPRRCEICGESNHYIPLTISVHAHCKLAVLDKMLAAYRGEV